MIRTIISSAMMLVITASISLAGTKWLHIKVDERGHHEERVRINLPLSLIETILPMIEADEFHKGRIQIDHCELDDVDIKGILRAVRDAEDGEYVTVQSDDEDIKVVKKDELLLIDVNDNYEQVHVKVRMDLLEALISDDSEELDLMAAIEKLGDDDEGMLITVDGDDETVRIWVDSNSSAE